jgi:hypothetical protein
MKRDDYLKTKNIFKEMDILEKDINRINYVFTNSDANIHTFEIYHNSKIHITNDELRFILKNRNDRKEQLEKDLKFILQTIEKNS